MDGEGLAAPNIQLGKRNGAEALATVSATPMGCKNLAYPPGLIEPRICGREEEGLSRL